MENVKRVNGFIDLDNYFKEKYNLSNTSIPELYEKGIITDEEEGSFALFWFNDEDNSYLFKTTKSVQNAYIELINEEFLKNIGLESTHYDLAVYKNKAGVISEDFKKENYDYLSMYGILYEYYYDIYASEDFNIFEDANDATDRLNNLDHIWFALEHKYRNNPNKQVIVSKLMIDIAKLFIYDLFTNQSDRHCSNYMICTDKDDPNNVSIAPIYDNDFSLSEQKRFNSSIMPDIENIDDLTKNSNDKILITFLNKASKEFVKIFYEAYMQLTPTKFLQAIKNVEDKYCIELPKILKNRLYITYLKNYMLINKTIKYYEDSTHRKKV